MSLRAEAVEFAYDARAGAVLRGVSAEVTPGVLAVIGPNGSGKSTLLRLLAGLAPARRGRVTLDGRGLDGFAAPARASRIAYVAQRPSVSAAFSVGESVGLGRYAVGRDDDAVEAALERLDLLGLRDRPFHALSAGQQQRVSLARALAQLGGGVEGRCLLVDEPTSAMDPAYVRATGGLLRRLGSAGLSVCLATHDLALAQAIADRVTTLSAGGAAGPSGPAREVLTRERLSALFDAPFVSARAGGGTLVLPEPPERGDGR